MIKLYLRYGNTQYSQLLRMARVDRRLRFCILTLYTWLLIKRE